MNSYLTGSTIRTLRERQSLTQKQLGDILDVTDKTVSKWETGNGLPDISLLEPLAAALRISVAELLSGDCRINRNRAANLLRGGFFACPVCGNVLYASGAGDFSCCGIRLPVLVPEEPDVRHTFTVTRPDGDLCLSLDHPMTREHYLPFCAYVTADRVQLCRLYPEQDPLVRFTRCGHGMLFVFCNHHGLFSQKI